MGKPTSVKPRFLSLFFIFLRIGSISFGGFMSLISVVEEAIVKKRKLLTQDEILDGIALASFLPGPMAVNVVTYVGYRIGGIRGAVFSAVGVILPSFILVVILSEIYFNYGDFFDLNRIFSGIVPAVAAIVVSVAMDMFKKNIKKRWETALVIFAFGSLFLISSEMRFYATMIIMIAYGLFGFIKSPRKNKVEVKKEIIKFDYRLLMMMIFFGVIIAILSFLKISDPNSLLRLASTFSGLSVMLFGGGYVFIPMIQDVVVDQYAWVTEQQFIDGIAIGQFTPGPIVISVAFIGYHVKGIIGAIVATIAIFLPPAILMVLATKLMEFIKNDPRVISMLKYIKLAVIGMIFYAGYIILKKSLSGITIFSYDSLMPLAIFGLAIVALKKFNVSIASIIILAGIIGYLVHY